MQLVRVRELWERQVGEGSRDFALFTLYRDQDAKVRALKDTVTAAKNAGVRASYGNVSSLSSKWDWRSRAAAWDDECDRILRENFMLETAATGRYHATVARRFILKVEERLETLDADSLQPREMAQWFKVAVEVERISRNMSTANIAVKDESDTAVRDFVKDIIARPEALELVTQLGNAMFNEPIDGSPTPARHHSLDASESGELSDEEYGHEGEVAPSSTLAPIISIPR